MLASHPRTTRRYRRPKTLRCNGGVGERPSGRYELRSPDEEVDINVAEPREDRAVVRCFSSGRPPSFRATHVIPGPTPPLRLTPCSPFTPIRSTSFPFPLTAIRVSMPAPPFIACCVGVASGVGPRDEPAAASPHCSSKLEVTVTGVRGSNPVGISYPRGVMSSSAARGTSSERVSGRTSGVAPPWGRWERRSLGHDRVSVGVACGAIREPLTESCRG